MTELSALNLKEAILVKGDGGNFGANKDYAPIDNDYEIPSAALNNKSKLTSLILPDRLVKIKDNAFSDCVARTGSLIIPEGVVEIESAAFRYCKCALR